MQITLKKDERHISTRIGLLFTAFGLIWITVWYLVSGFLAEDDTKRLCTVLTGGVLYVLLTGLYVLSDKTHPVSLP